MKGYNKIKISLGLVLVLFLLIGLFFVLRESLSSEKKLIIKNPEESPISEQDKTYTETQEQQDKRNEKTIQDEPETQTDTFPEETEPIKKSKNDTSETDQDTPSPKKLLVSWGYEAPTEKRSIDTIIIHSSYDALGKDPYSVDGLIKEYETYGVAAHYLIDRNGNVYQLVKDENIAYHAGQSKVPDGRTGVNYFSIGIELMNTEKDTYTKEQYSSLNRLLSDLKKEYAIKYILGHNDIAPERKTDPWNFEWDKIKK